MSTSSVEAWTSLLAQAIGQQDFGSQDFEAERAIRKSAWKYSLDSDKGRGSTTWKNKQF